jgi:hypothetical protein
MDYQNLERFRSDVRYLFPSTHRAIGNSPLFQTRLPGNQKKKQSSGAALPLAGQFVRQYVDELHKQFDIKFSLMVQKKKTWVSSAKLGNAVSRRQFLTYKYILSLPGNDVATNLKWLMMQNSVIVMPPPRVEGWLMEGLLEPYVHYVPIHDPRNMSAVIHWMRSHDNECQKIVKNANAWIRMVKTFEPYLTWIFNYAKNKNWNQRKATSLPSQKNFD